jgi:hypothetical protein
MTVSANAQTLTITGANFAAGATVKASYPSGTPVTLSTSSISSTSITASFTPGTTAREWGVVVTNPDGTASAAQPLAIAGTNFAAGATVQASYTGGTPVNLSVASVSATAIAASFSPGMTPRTWSVVVTNPGGTASAPASLQVAAGPAITSMSPSPMIASPNPQPLTITGANFAPGATVIAKYSGGPPMPTRAERHPRPRRCPWWRRPRSP